MYHHKTPPPNYLTTKLTWLAKPSNFRGLDDGAGAGEGAEDEMKELREEAGGKTEEEDEEDDEQEYEPKGDGETPGAAVRNAAPKSGCAVAWAGVEG